MGSMKIRVFFTELRQIRSHKKRDSEVKLHHYMPKRRVKWWLR